MRHLIFTDFIYLVHNPNIPMACSFQISFMANILQKVYTMEISLGGPSLIQSPFMSLGDFLFHSESGYESNNLCSQNSALLKAKKSPGKDHVVKYTFLSL